MNSFGCKYQYDDGEEKTWIGYWDFIKNNIGYCELLVRGRGSEYRVVLGSCSTGNYLCIPLVNIGCSLACWSDRFFNIEKLSAVVNITDAVTIANALLDYYKEIVVNGKLISL